MLVGPLLPDHEHLPFWLSFSQSLLKFNTGLCVIRPTCCYLESGVQLTLPKDGIWPSALSVDYGRHLDCSNSPAVATTASSAPIHWCFFLKTLGVACFHFVSLGSVFLFHEPWYRLVRKCRLLLPFSPLWSVSSVSLWTEIFPLDVFCIPEIYLPPFFPKLLFLLSIF